MSSSYLACGLAKIGCKGFVAPLVTYQTARPGIELTLPQQLSQDDLHVMAILHYAAPMQH